MSDPMPPLSAPHEKRTSHAPRPLPRIVSFAIVLEIALAFRVLVADALEWYLHRGGNERLCLFPDTDIYWQLARTIRMGSVYEIVEWADIPYFTLRTPGYPLFLAACQFLFGENTLAVRLVQALLGTVCVYLVYRLTQRLLPDHEPAARNPVLRSSHAALIAALLVAVHPYFAIMSILILSESLFEPLMLASLFAIAMLWNDRSPSAEARLLPETNRFSRAPGVAMALGGGAAAGASLLVRPSWAIFVPIMLAAWLIDSRHDRDQFMNATKYAFIFIVSLCLVMSPWWIRNARVHGRFVPTALWMGASLYDGLNVRATGASDMSFRNDPEIWPLDESDQDHELTRRSIAFARENPRRVAELALEKIKRYWSPWPNADLVRGAGPLIAGAALELPLYALAAWGIWLRRRDVRALVLLAGPVVYFCALHAVFASSMRYRLPGEVPAVGFAAAGLLSLMNSRTTNISR